MRLAECNDCVGSYVAVPVTVLFLLKEIGMSLQIEVSVGM